MREALALIAREWRLVRGVVLLLLACAVPLCTLAVLSLEPHVRFLLLQDHGIGPRLLPLWAMSFAFVLAHQSFVHEMNHRTWDGLLLLGCSRGLLLAVKLGAGLALIVTAVAFPLLLVEALMALGPATGGPVPTVSELCGLPLVRVALLLGVMAYLGVTSASLMLHDRLPSFWLLTSLLGITSVMLLDGQWTLLARGLGPVNAVLLSGVVLAVLPPRKRGVAALFAARAVCLMPAGFLLLLLAGHLGQTLLPRVGSSLSTPDSFFTSAPVTFVSVRGQIVHDRRHSRSSGMSMVHSTLPGESRAGEPEPPTWVWREVDRTKELILFQHRHQGALAAYHRHSGLPAGCLGRDGLRAVNCAPFGGTFRTTEVPEGTLVAATHGVFRIDGRTLAVTELHRGDVRGVADVRDGVVVQSGADLLLWAYRSPRDERATRDEHGEAADGADRQGEPARGGGDAELSLRPCRGALGDGILRGAMAEPPLLAVRVLYPASRRQSLVICRDGEVTERRDIPYDEYADEDRALLDERVAGSGVLQAALGPVLSSSDLPGLFPRSYRREHPSTEARVLSVAVTAAGVVALLVAFAARRRQRIPAAVRALAVLGGLVLGPSFSLASVLLLTWRQRVSGAAPGGQADR